MKISDKRLQLSFNSPVILGFTIACFIVLIIDKVTGGASTNALFSVYRSSLFSPLTYVRFFGHVLGHAGWEHFIGNIMLILIVGPLLEEKYGSSNIDHGNGISDWYRSVYFLPTYTVAGSKRSCICFDLTFFFYQF